MKRGEVWLVNLDPVRGHEQAGTRPVVVLSSEVFNLSMAGIVSVLPITSKARALPTRVLILPPEGGVKTQSYVICEQTRTIARERMKKRLGELRPATMDAVSDIVRVLLEL